MSVAAVDWAFDAIGATDLKPSGALVLLALAHCHNGQTGRCDPSLGFLCTKTGLCERAVRAALRDLEAARLLITVHRKQTRMVGAWNRTNAYTLTGVGKSCRGMGRELPPKGNGEGIRA